MSSTKRLFFGTVKAQGETDKDAPYGWVEGVANGYVCDRYDELVDPPAIASAAAKFMLNPVMSFGHGIEGNPVNGTLPAGSVLKIWQDAKRDSLFRARWANTPEAQKVRQMYKDGDMRGFSVQFIPLDSRPPTPEELSKWPTLRRVITQLDLIEIACAVVPVNQASLVTASKSLATPRKLSVPAEGASMEKRALSPEEMKSLDTMVQQYNTTAEGMATLAQAIDDIRSNAANEDDHAPRMTAAVTAHKGMGVSLKDMGGSIGTLASGFGVKAEGDPAEEGAEDPDAEVDPNADPNAPDPAKPKPGAEPDATPEEQAKSFGEAFQAALKA